MKIIHTIFSIPVAVRSRVTVQNPVKYGGKNYTCTILGDTKTVHFGAPDYDHPVPRATIDCKRIG